MNNLAGLYYSQGRYGEAEPLYQETVEIMVEALGRQHPNAQTCIQNLIVFYRNQGKAREANEVQARYS